MAAADKARYTRELASFKGKQTDVVVPVEAPTAAAAAAALLAPKKRGRKKEEPVVLGSGQIEPKKPKSALMYVSLMSEKLKPANATILFHAQLDMLLPFLIGISALMKPRES